MYTERTLWIASQLQRRRGHFWPIHQVVNFFEYFVHAVHTGSILKTASLLASVVSVKEDLGSFILELYGGIRALTTSRKLTSRCITHHLNLLNWFALYFVLKNIQVIRRRPAFCWEDTGQTMRKPTKDLSNYRTIWMLSLWSHEMAELPNNTLCEVSSHAGKKSLRHEY